MSAAPLVGAAERVQQMQLALGAGDADITKPPLLLQAGRIVNRKLVRQQVLLHPRNEDHRKLQPLGLVQRDQRHGVRRTVGQIVDIRDERDILKEGVQRGARRDRAVVVGHGE